MGCGGWWGENTRQREEQHFVAEKVPCALSDRRIIRMGHLGQGGEKQR